MDILAGGVVEVEMAAEEVQVEILMRMVTVSTMVVVVQMMVQVVEGVMV